MVARVDPPSAARIQSRDLVRLVRALEVYLLTGVPLTAHFSATVSPLPGVRIVALCLDVPAEVLNARIERRVEDQFRRGLVAETRALVDAGIPLTARPFGSLGYRQVVEHLHGDRDEAATRDVIVRETRHYARRQLIWFRKEPNLDKVTGPGDLRSALDAASRILDRRLSAPAPGTDGEEFC